MKNLLTVAFLGLTLSMQSQSYDFIVSTGTYTNLEGSTSLNDSLTWEDPEFAIPIGFDFQYFGLIINEILIDEWGLGAELSTGPSDTGEPHALLIPYGADIADRGIDFLNDTGYTTNSLSNISYLLEGATGNRVLKIEWNNVGFLSEMYADNISSDFTNFQLWLYEGTNDIEIHYGPNSITQPDLSFEEETGSHVALFPAYDFDKDSVLIEGIVLTGNPSSPEAISTNSYYENFLDGIIPNGTIYKFTNNVVDAPDYPNNLIEFTIYPNPSVEYFKISFDNIEQKASTISVTNINRQLVKAVNFTNGIIDISDLNPGNYFVEIETKAGILTKSLVKQ